MKGPIQSVEVSYLVHATEDVDRLQRTVMGILGIDCVAEVEELEGHYGNKILRVSHHLTGEAAASTYSRLVEKLPQEQREEIDRDLNGYMDEHFALHLSLDKQGLVNGRVTLGSVETVKVKIKPRLFQLRGGVADFYRRSFEGQT
jgi:RNA binding exosome subunit